MSSLVREVRFLGERLVPFPGTRVTLATWGRILDGLRKRMTQRFPVFRNAALLSDVLGNLVAITVLPERGTATIESWVSPLTINVVLRGGAPWAWKDGFPELLHLGTFEPLCPRCAQADILAPLATTKAQLTLGEARTGRMRTLKREKLTCQAGHTVAMEEQVSGVLREANTGILQENVWRPASGKLFFTETDRAGRWFGCEVCTKARGSTEPRPVFTILDQAEPSPARCAEYARARGLFYSFLGEELSTKVELAGVVFVRHGRREERFAATVFDMHKR
jgi:hypothetical protein